MSRPNYITPNGLARIQGELEWLQRVERPAIVQEVHEAAALGDRSENAAYIYGKKRLRSIDSRMRFLMGRLGHLIVQDPAALSGPKVRFGATVSVEDEQGQQRTWRIYGEDEVDVERGILSWRSPIARALLGKEEGDEASYQAPGGRRTVEILEVTYQRQGELETWRDREPPAR